MRIAVKFESKYPVSVESGIMVIVRERAVLAFVVVSDVVVVGIRVHLDDE